MTALARFAQLFTGGDEPVPVEGAGRLAPAPDAGAVPALSDDEVEAQQAVQRAEAQLADLRGRHENLVATVEGLVAERSRLSRAMATGEPGAGARFGEVEVELSASRARLEGIGELLAEAEAGRQAAYAKLREASAPRREAERRARVEAATGRARAASERFCTLYAETSAALAALADELDSLSGLDVGAAFGIGYQLATGEGDPLRRLEASGWTVRPWSAHVGLRYVLVGLTPPKDR